MKCTAALTTLALAYASTAFGALCTTGGLLGLGDAVTTFPPDYQFILIARNSSGGELGVNTDNEGDYAPLTLADASASLFFLPQFVLSNGTLQTYGTNETRYVTTKSDPLLSPTELYTSPEGVGTPIKVAADNVTCDSAGDYAIRFQGLLPLSTGSGSYNGSFAVNSSLSSPILEPLLPLSLEQPIDLILLFF